MKDKGAGAELLLSIDFGNGLHVHFKPALAPKLGSPPVEIEKVINTGKDITDSLTQAQMASIYDQWRLRQ